MRIWLHCRDEDNGIDEVIEDEYAAMNEEGSSDVEVSNFYNLVLYFIVILFDRIASFPSRSSIRFPSTSLKMKIVKIIVILMI